MAKKQTFGDKTGKAIAKGQNTCIKIVRAGKSNKNKDSIRFSEEMHSVPNGESVDNYVLNLLGNSK